MTDREVQLERLERRFDWPLLIAAVLVIPAVAIDLSHLPSPWPAIGSALNWVSWTIFFVEAVVMLKAVGWLWVRRNPLPLIVTVITTPVLPANLDAARLLRFARLLRVIPGASAARRLFTIEGVKYAAMIVLATVVLGGLLFAQVETDQDPPIAPLDGIWWAVTTITTVGYGDVKPETAAGRVLAGIVMLVGISFVALVTAFIAERFIAHDAELEDDRERLERELAALRSDVTEINRKLDLLLDESKGPP